MSSGRTCTRWTALSFARGSWEADLKPVATPLRFRLVPISALPGYEGWEAKGIRKRNSLAEWKSRHLETKAKSDDKGWLK